MAPHHQPSATFLSQLNKWQPVCQQCGSVGPTVYTEATASAYAELHVAVEAARA